jgi:hypothetical protein
VKLFRRYIGIDYSGARSPTCRLKALQVSMASSGKEPEKISAAILKKRQRIVPEFITPWSAPQWPA